VTTVTPSTWDNCQKIAGSRSVDPNSEFAVYNCDANCKAQATTCCQSISVTASGQALLKQKKSLGKFFFYKVGSNGSPIYKNSRNQYLYLSSIDKWKIGKDYTNTRSGISHPTCKEDCPNRCTNQWNYYDKGDKAWHVDNSIKISCVDDCDDIEIDCKIDGAKQACPKQCTEPKKCEFADCSRIKNLEFCHITCANEKKEYKECKVDDECKENSHAKVCVNKRCKGCGDHPNTMVETDKKKSLGTVQLSNGQDYTSCRLLCQKKDPTFEFYQKVDIYQNCECFKMEAGYNIKSSDHGSYTLGYNATCPTLKNRVGRRLQTDVMDLLAEKQSMNLL